MPSLSPSPVNNFLDRRKPTRRASVDDLALVKAAARAWYQHGSGSERPMREFDLESTEKVQKPSRYKLEAIREEESRPVPKHQHSNSTIPILSTSPSHDYISDLLDKYEVQRISRLLDYYIETGHAAYCNDLLGDSDRWRVVSLSESDTSERKHKRPSKGFWLRHAMVCGLRTDVVETGSIGCSRWPRDKYIPVVKTVGCRPWASCI